MSVSTGRILLPPKDKNISYGFVKLIGLLAKIVSLKPLFNFLNICLHFSCVNC
jgi:hypothetical protein